VESGPAESGARRVLGFRGHGGGGKTGTGNRKARRDLVCNQDSSLQPWAFDLPPSTAGGAAAPKRYVAARAMDFSSAYMALPQEQRHAYEIVRKSKPCWAFFDLERLECTGEADAWAREIARVASGLLIERTLELLGRAVSVQVLALDSSRPGKFSRHLILRARAEPCGTPIMLSGPPAAGALARAVVSRLPAEGALRRLGCLRRRPLLSPVGLVEAGSPSRRAGAECVAFELERGGPGG
jgi:hypothetical protein